MKTKKCLFLFFIISFLGIGNYNLYSKNHTTIKAGLSHSYFRDDNNSDPKNAFSIGISREFELTENLSIYPELFVTTQGGILKNKPIYNEMVQFDSIIYAYDIKLAVTYIEVPFLLNYRFFSHNESNLRFIFGPSFRFVLSEAASLSNRNKLDEFIAREKSEYLLNYYDEPYGLLKLFVRERGLSINFGFQFNYRYLYLETRFTYTIRKMEQTADFPNIPKHLNSLHLLIGISI